LKILHTSDVHLREHEDPRWNALERILSLGKKKAIDLLVVGGDLFDSKSAADSLHAEVQSLFDSTVFPIILLPGNHDAEAYPQGSYFGKSVRVIEDLYRPVEMGDAVIWGFPFANLKGEEILGSLRRCADKVDRHRCNLLVFHGELLDVSGDWQNYGEEGELRYMPVKLSYFAHLPWDYVLAGHFHTRFTVRQIKEGGFFVYPGSPLPVSRKETGKRKINLLETGGPPEECPLDTPFFHELEIRLDPFRDIDPLSLLEKELKTLPPDARILLRIHGFFDHTRLKMTEQQLADGIDAAVAGRIEDRDLQIRDIHEVLQDEIFLWFNQRLGERLLDEERKGEIRELAVRALMEMKP
jgi:DNA repair exonuclease SbcCD nuclease subunit